MLILLLLIVLYLYAIKPNLKRKAEMKDFEKVLYTHRGYFNNLDIPENSLKAFKKTRDKKMGTELDVQLTSDNKLVVFHDVSLKRMCNLDMKLTDLTYDELNELHLLDTDEKIPLFSEVLDTLGKDVPIIVEIKPEDRAIETCDRAIELLNKYENKYVMESFNPLVVKHLKDKYPDIIRGQLTYDYIHDEKLKNKSLLLRFVMTYCLSNFYTKPDFVAMDIHNQNISFKLISKLYKAECVAWTVKSKEELEQAKEYYQQFIFDSFDPE
ncbi:MAG: glycerophosphodiester phosphodiesterase family protein [Erysipelotrichaceae bacterium]|nr:glycerophosphodiester phosphodiesterase family protein [Erysipelotrichaceae bacterium]